MKRRISISRVRRPLAFAMAFLFPFVGVVLYAGVASAAGGAVSLHNYSTDKCIGVSNNYAGDWYCTWTSGSDQTWIWNGGEIQDGKTIFDYTDTVYVVHDGVTYSATDMVFTQYRNARYTNQCLAVSGGSTAPKAQLRIWPCASSASANHNELWANVRWDWMPYGTYYLINYNSMLATGVIAGSGTNGAAVIQYTLLDHPDQWWEYFNNP